MDFNSKSKSWAGNLYHQFESICQDVDGFIKKETVKLVGNQVQNVGNTVKILYSNVVQDIVTLSEDTEEPERQSAAGELDGMLDPISIADVKTTTPCTDEKQLPNDQVSNDHKMQICKLANTLESQSCQYLAADGKTIVHTSEDNCSAENTATEGVLSVTADSIFDREISYGKSDEDYLSSSPVFSAHEEDSTSIEKERREFNTKKVDTDSDDTIYLSETLSTGLLSKSVSSVSEDRFSDESESLSSPPMPVSTHENDNFLLMDSPLPPTSDTDDSASEEGRVSCESCSMECVMPHTYCTSSKLPITMESTSADFPKNAENILHSRGVSDGGTHNISSAFSINAADATKEATSADFITKAENILHSHSVSDGCIDNISAAFSINVADITKEATSADYIAKTENILHSHSVSDGCTDNISAAFFINVADTTKEATSGGFIAEAENILHSHSVSDGCTDNISTAFSINDADITKEATSADFIVKAENIIHSHSVSDSCTDNISAAFSISVADTTKEATSADFIAIAENIVHSHSVSDGCTDNIFAAFPINVADTTKEATSGGFIAEAENILHSHSVSDGCTDNISAAFFINVADTTKEATSADFIVKAENILHSHSISDGCTDNMSAAFPINVTDTTKEATSADFIAKAENILHSHSVPDSCICNISAESSINTNNSSLQNNRSESLIGSSESGHEEYFSDGHSKIVLSPSETDNNGYNALQTKRSESLIGSSESRHEEYYGDGHSKIVISPSETDNNALLTNRSESLIDSSESGHEEYHRDGHSKIVISPPVTENTHVLSGPIGDLDLESIDLSPNPKHYTKSVALNSNFVLAGSYRRRDFQYYKNLIKDALTSQKRLSKEYEHLALVYEDIDEKPNQLFEPSSLSSSPDTALPVAGTLASQEMKDEWELL